MVKVNGLVKRYGDLVALDHLDLEIREGEVFGLLGPNGSGKTTLINCILALIKYEKGGVTVMGEQMKPTSYSVKQNIGVVMQEVAVFDQMNVKENIDYFCGLYVKNKEERKKLVEEAIKFVGLGGFEKMRPKKLSGGLLRRLNIACGIAHKPKLVILDEPTVAVDPQSRNKILEGIQELNRNGSTIIYTSHYMEEVEQIATRIAIIDHGRVLATGTTEELKQMIRPKENITVQTIQLEETQLDEIKKLPHVIDVNYTDMNLKIKFGNDEHNLIELLNYLKDKNVPFGRVFSERPTLNDVFLEITGTELRDQAG